MKGKNIYFHVKWEDYSTRTKVEHVEIDLVNLLNANYF